MREERKVPRFIPTAHTRPTASDLTTKESGINCQAALLGHQHPVRFSLFSFLGIIVDFWGLRRVVCSYFMPFHRRVTQKNLPSILLCGCKMGTCFD